MVRVAFQMNNFKKIHPTILNTVKVRFVQYTDVKGMVFRARVHVLRIGDIVFLHYWVTDSTRMIKKLKI